MYIYIYVCVYVYVHNIYIYIYININIYRHTNNRGECRSILSMALQSLTLMIGRRVQGAVKLKAHPCSGLLHLIS